MNFQKTLLVLGLAVMLSLGLTTTVSAIDHWGKPSPPHHAYYQPHHQLPVTHGHNGKHHHHYKPYYPQHHGYYNKNCRCPSCRKHGYGNKYVPTIKIGNVWFSLGHDYKNW
ncbi:MAG: hypothetical protein LBG58_01545 [Planctomycetaceae bacterium]|nr:hypothetical protein [Planctomycetaceae bacterium]